MVVDYGGKRENTLPTVAGFAYQCTTGVEAASFAEQNSRLPPELVSVGLRNSPNFPYRRGMVVLEDIYGCPL